MHSITKRFVYAIYVFPLAAFVLMVVTSGVAPWLGFIVLFASLAWLSYLIGATLCPKCGEQVCKVGFQLSRPRGSRVWQVPVRCESCGADFRSEPECASAEEGD